MTAPRKTMAGFTLVELLVVIAVIALVLATVLMARPKAISARLAVTARTVASTLQFARDRAMAGNKETVVQIDTASGQFGFSNSIRSLPRGMKIALTVAQTERAGSRGGIRFFPDGQSSGGVVALSLEGKSASIAVNWLTGEPRLNQ